MVTSKLKYFISSASSSTRFIRIVVQLVCLLSASTIALSQNFSLNTGNGLDDYQVLKDMMISPMSDTDNPLLHYRINQNLDLFLQLFIGTNDFTLKSDIDLLNRRIYAQANLSSPLRWYDFQRTKIDSFYLLSAKNASPTKKYIYHPEEDVYALVLDQGRYNLVEGYFLSIQKGKTNPLLDSGTEVDRVVLKKKYYLVDTSRWYKIPKQKNKLVDFIRTHFKRSIKKDKIDPRNPIETLSSLNHID